MARPRTPFVRLELEQIVAEYHHLRAEHRRAGPESSVRRRMEARLEELDRRFERLLEEWVPEERLRQELRAFLKETLPPDWQGLGSEISDDDWEFGQWFNKKLAERGWIAPAWPKEYGGLGATYIEQAIFGEELAYHRAPNGGRI
ncbi:MAG: hypothetical protein C4307_05090, partial [Chloroflexota bacterium]